jgi:hypothetical protein
MNPGDVVLLPLQDAAGVPARKDEGIMNIREALDKVLADLPEARLWEVLDFARYVRWLEKEAQEEAAAWSRITPAMAAELWGPDEPEYTEADIKPNLT